MSIKNIVAAKFKRSQVDSNSISLFESLDEEKQRTILNFAKIPDYRCFIVQWINSNNWLLLADTFLINYKDDVLTTIDYVNINTTEPVIDMDSLNNSRKIHKVNTIQINYNLNDNYHLLLEIGTVGTILSLLRFLIQHCKKTDAGVY